jgi:hypothetical protein
MKRNRWIIAALLAGVLLATSAQAKRSEYEIVIDGDGNLVSGSGDGAFNGSWYYYPDQAYYIIWFPNGLYDPQRIGYLDMWAYITTPNPQGGVLSAEVGFVWSSEQWDISNPQQPPLPGSIGSASFSDMIKERIFSKNLNAWRGPDNSIEPHQEKTIYEYNPAWVGVVIRGRNVKVYRWLTHECNAADGSDDGNGGNNGGGTTQPTGACCNTQTGSCYISTQASCASPYTWLGAGTTCADCDPDLWRWDYGDAPASYRVLKRDDGARHYLNGAMFLGQGVTPEQDGQPSTQANMDLNDDGVTFSSAFTVGSTSLVNVTASRPGVVSAWLDLNRDGDWADPGERVLVDEPVNSGNNNLLVSIPNSALEGNTFIRFRYSSQTGLNYYGQASDGEVEDYAVAIGTGSGLPSTQYPPQSPSHKYVPRWTQGAVPVKDQEASLNGWPDTSLQQTRPVVADDWIADKADAVTGLRWWGSFESWSKSTPPDRLPDAFKIMIWSDPVAAGVPSTIVWQTEVQAWSWSFSGFVNDPRGLMSGQTLFEFAALFSQDEWFLPTPNISGNYWLSVAAVYNAPPNTHGWGWMTRPHHHGSPALRIFEVAGNTGQSKWPPSIGDMALEPQAVELPQGTPWDMCFELMTKTQMASGETGFVTGDVDGNGIVTLQDLSMLVNMWLAENQ